MHVADASERVTQKLTDATGRVVEQVATTVTQMVGEEQLPVERSTAPADPILPPLPEWVNDWLAPETVQSIEEWGVRASAAANAGKAAVADAANATARAMPKANHQTPSTSMADDLDVEASQAIVAANLEADKTRNKSDGTDAPWLAHVVGWLVPIVWVIWGVGLLLGLSLTLISKWESVD